MLGNYSGKGRGNSIETTPPLQIVDDVTKYCFNATLRSINISINTTIVIEGTINLVNISGGWMSSYIYHTGVIPYIAAVSVLSILAFVGFSLALVFGVIACIIYRRYCYN